MFQAIFGKAKTEKAKLQPLSIWETSVPLQVQRTAEADSILTYTFERKTILQILSVTDNFLHVRDIVDHRGFIDRAKFESALGPISEDWTKFLYGRRSKAPIISAFEYATAGMMGEAKEVLNLTTDRDLDSKMIKVVEKATPFRVLRRNVGSRRCEVKLLTKEGQVGWLSLLTRTGVPTCDHMSRQNLMLQGVIDPHTSIQIGQSMSLTKPVQLTKGEDSLEVIKALPIHTAVAIKKFGHKYPLRIKIGVTHENADGWISMIDETGTDVLGLEQYPADLSFQVSRVCDSDDVRAFAELGLIDLNHQCGGNNETPLMLASTHGSADIVEYLLNRGAAVNAVSSLGLSAMNYVSNKPSQNVCLALLNALADVNHVDRQGCSLLMSLAGQKPDDAVISTLKLLLERLADPNLLDTNGETALDMARENKWDEAVRLMRAHSGRGGTKGKGMLKSPTSLRRLTDSPQSKCSRNTADNTLARALLLRLSGEATDEANEKQEGDSGAVQNKTSGYTDRSAPSAIIVEPPHEAIAHGVARSDESPKLTRTQSARSSKVKSANISVTQREGGGDIIRLEESELEKLPLKELLQKRKNLYDQEISAASKNAPSAEIDLIGENREAVNKVIYSQAGNIRFLCRPLASSKPSTVVELIEDGTTVNVARKASTSYTFDRAFPASATQDDVFENSLRSQSQHVFDGNNLAVITVGTMRAGKSYTMFGNVDKQRDHGLALRATAELLHVATTLKETRNVEMSFVLGELFKNSWFDLIAMTPVSHFKELKPQTLNSLDAVSDAVRVGFQARQVLLSEDDEDDPKRPQYSTVFLQILVDTIHQSTKQKTSGRYTFVDTGSSDICKTRGGSGAFANRALEHLGHVLKEMASKAKQVPYSENKMTQPFSNAPMSIPSETVVIACVSTSERLIGGTEKTFEFINALQEARHLVRRHSTLSAAGSRLKSQSSLRRT